MNLINFNPIQPLHCQYPARSVAPVDLGQMDVGCISKMALKELSVMRLPSVIKFTANSNGKLFGHCHQIITHREGYAVGQDAPG